MRTPRLSDERGVALAVAVFALVVIGALVAGTFFAGQLEQQSGRNTLYAAQAGEAAEAAYNAALGAATGEALQAMLVTDAPMALSNVSMGGGYTTGSASVTRLSSDPSNIFLIRALGSRVDAQGNAMATRSIGTIVRLEAADLPVNAGLTARGDITVTGNAQVSGMDDVPDAWLSAGVACPPTDNVTGIRYNDGTLDVKGSSKVSGEPESEKDPTLTQAKITDMFNELKKLATITLTTDNPSAANPVTVGNPARCDKTVMTNWGDPITKASPCWTYFPIIYRPGNLKLQGDMGQGILLVEGDLTVTGSMVFYGPVVVTGTLSTAGNSSGGSKFYGGVIAGNVALDDNKVSGGAMVNYSSCALKRAFTNSATVQPLTERSWVQLYN